MNQESQDTEALKVSQDPLDCQDLKEKRATQEKTAQSWDLLGLEVNQGQWGSEEREGSMGKKAIRAIWVSQDSEVPRDNKDPQVNQVTRANKD